MLTTSQLYLQSLILSPDKASLWHISSTKRLSDSLTPHHTTISLSSSLLAILKSEEMKKLINQQKKLQNSRANLILQPLQQAVKHTNICLPNGNGYEEINLKMDDIALQTTFPHLFNLPPILKPCVTKEKSLATLSNAEQVIATLETTTNLQFLQKTYPALIEKKYKYVSILSIYAPNMRTTAKSSTMSQALYIYQIYLEQNKTQPP